MLRSFDVSLAFIINDVGFLQRVFICMLNECCIEFRMLEFVMRSYSYFAMSSLELLLSLDGSSSGQVLDVRQQSCD